MIALNQRGPLLSSGPVGPCGSHAVKLAPSPPRTAQGPVSARAPGVQFSLVSASYRLSVSGPKPTGRSGQQSEPQKRPAALRILSSLLGGTLVVAPGSGSSSGQEDQARAAGGVRRGWGQGRGPSSVRSLLERSCWAAYTLPAEGLSPPPSLLQAPPGQRGLEVSGSRDPQTWSVGALGICRRPGQVGHLLIAPSAVRLHSIVRTRSTGPPLTFPPATW